MKIIGTTPRGKLGNVVYRKTKNGLVVCAAPRKYDNPRTERQMRNRCQLSNLSANSRLYADHIDRLIENKRPGQCYQNIFVQMNHGQNPVYLTKQESAERSCVLAPYIFSRGTLASIGHRISEEGLLVSGLALGSLKIGIDTTVAQFSKALINHNPGWYDGDVLCFLYAVQFTDRNDKTPRAEMEVWKLALDTTGYADPTLLYDAVTPLGFTTHEGHLATSQPLANAGAAWLHARALPNGSLQVSTQRLCVVSDFLADYQSEEAFHRAAESYGGFNSKAVFLNAIPCNSSILP